MTELNLTDKPKYQYDIKKFSKDEFKIQHADSGWYIVKPHPTSLFDAIYIHKDGTLHEICGSRNFFETRIEAQMILNKAFNENEDLPEELFQI